MLQLLLLFKSWWIDIIVFSLNYNFLARTRSQVRRFTLGVVCLSVGHSKNQAVAQSSGEFLCFQDSVCAALHSVSDLIQRPFLFYACLLAFLQVTFWFLQDDIMLPQRVRLQFESSLLHPKSVSSQVCSSFPPVTYLTCFYLSLFWRKVSVIVWKDLDVSWFVSLSWDDDDVRLHHSWLAAKSAGCQRDPRSVTLAGSTRWPPISSRLRWPERAQPSECVCACPCGSLHACVRLSGHVWLLLVRIKHRES